MNTKEVAVKTIQYDSEMKNMGLSYKNSYEEPEREEIFKLCRKISRSTLPDSCESKDPVKVEVLRPYFLRSLKIFENSNIVDYFDSKTKDVTLVRKSPEVSLFYNLRAQGRNRFKLNLPPKKLTMSDQMGYAHEIGHIPEIEMVRKSFLEYSEALPMFMEYLMELRKYKNKEDAKRAFLSERLPMEQEEARSLMKIYKRIDETRNNAVRVYNTQLFADYYKFLESLEFVLNLIDIMDDDLYAVGDEVEDITNGKSLIATARSLNIVTDGCPKLSKEYKKMSR